MGGVPQEYPTLFARSEFLRTAGWPIFASPRLEQYERKAKAPRLARGFYTVKMFGKDCSAQDDRVSL